MMEMFQLHSEFWSKIAGKYDPVVDSRIGTNTRAMVRERLMREQSFGAAVEFDCGTGFYTGVLAARSDHLIATDLAPGMLELAKQNTKATNVTFQHEDCQQTSFSDSAFDTIFMSLVLHFTNAPMALAEMRRILKPGGTLIISNPDPHPLSGFDRFRWIVRGYFYGITRYRTKPPKGLLNGVLAEKQLCDLLVNAGFKVVSSEAIKDKSRSYNIPVEYIKAVKSEPTSIIPACANGMFTAGPEQQRPLSRGWQALARIAARPSSRSL